MIRNFRGVKMTANQLAKELVWQYGERSYYWTDLMPEEYRAMTQREVDDLEAAIGKHFCRVQKFLNISDDWYTG